MTPLGAFGVLLKQVTGSPNFLIRCFAICVLHPQRRDRSVIDKSLSSSRVIVGWLATAINDCMRFI
jgi:hypothetical protein